MNLDITYDDCLGYYEYFYSKISGNQGFEFTPNKREKVCINNFLQLLSKESGSYGREFLFDYLCFGFAKYEGLTTNQGKNNIKVMWVLGPKVFNEYRNRDFDRVEWVISNLKKNYRIKKSDCLGENNEKISLYKINSKERKRFTDKDRQLIHCLENGLFNLEATDCIICSNKKICIKDG